MRSAPRRSRLRRVPALAALLALCGGLAFPGCATNPVTGRREFTLVSTGQEEQMGREGYTAVLAEYGAYGDTALQGYVSPPPSKANKHERR